MTDTPPALVEVIWLSPCISPNCRSSGAVTVVAITSGTGAGIKSDHLDRRIVHLGQSRNRQLGECHNARQQNCGHQQRGRNRPQNEWPGWTHGAPSVYQRMWPGIVTFDWKTGEPFSSFWKLLLATTSPGLIPSLQCCLDRRCPTLWSSSPL